jgi:hypothetical protein
MHPSLRLMNFDGRLHSRAFQISSTDLQQLRNLRILIFRNFAKLKKLPEELGELASLRVLNLEGCESIWKLPEGFGRLKNLEELVLKRCRNLRELCNVSTFKRRGGGVRNPGRIYPAATIIAPGSTAREAISDPPPPFYL